MATYSFPQAGQTLTVSENGGLQNIGGELDLNLFAPSASGFILTIAGLLADDRLGFEPTTGFSFANGLIKLNGALVAVATGGAGGDLVIAFGGGAQSGDIATLLHQLAYQTVSDTPAAQRTLNLTLTGPDGPVGNGGAPSFAEITGTANPFDDIDINDATTGETSVAFADIDGDGDRDLYTVSSVDRDVDYWRNDGGEFVKFESAHAFAGGVREAGVFADFNGDGVLDYVVENSNAIEIEFNTGSTTAPDFPSSSTTYPLGINTRAIAAGDLDADGDIDIVLSTLNLGVRYVRNDGSTTVPVFTLVDADDSPWDIAPGNKNFRPTLGDLDGDGDLDMAVVQDNADNTGALVRYFRNQGTAEVPDFVELTGGNNPFAAIALERFSSAQLEDVDRDGDLDLVTASPDGAIRLFLNSTSTTPTTIIVAVTAQNDAPSVTSTGPYSVAENVTAVGTASASDPDGNTLAFSLTGADAGLFNISSSGVITFKTAPNFEAPADVGGNNVYDLTVVATDSGGLSGTKAVTVMVTDVAGVVIDGGGAGQAHVGSVEADTIRGNGGNDTLTGLGGRDGLNGGKGFDTALYTEKSAGIAVSLDGSAAVMLKVGGVDEDTLRNIEHVTGGSGDDIVRGDTLANRLVGNSGDDLLVGRDGNDTLSGGLGVDMLKGGDGRDAFVFNSALGSGNVDVVKDFRHDVDALRLDDKIFADIGSALSAAEFHAKDGAVKAHDATDRIVYDTATGNLYYDADGKGGDAAVLFATLSNRPGLDHGDFAIV